MHFFFADNKQFLVIRLDRGDMLLESIEEAARQAGVTDGYIASCIGTLDIAKLHLVMTTGYPPVETYPTIVGPLELNSAAGILANGELHAHVTLSDSERCYGGHLEPGSRILYLGEVVLRIFSSDKMKRTPNPTTGVKELDVKA